jgi:hypothetical protein
VLVEFDLVLSYLRKERFLKGVYNMLKMKNIRPCEVLKEISNNGYHIEFSNDELDISLMF